MNEINYENTKIVATVGPACNTYDKLLELVQVGVDVFRLNFSHGTHEDHGKVIDHINKINETHNLHVGILADLQGPKIRIGKMENDGVPIEKGQIITFTTQECIGNGERVQINYANFPSDVKKGERLLLDDGRIVLEVMNTNGMNEVQMKVIYGTVLRSRKGVNLPDTKLTVPALTPKDLIDLDYILGKPVHWIALSFVRSPKDIKDLRMRLEANNHPAKIIAKVEKPEAIEKIDKIVKQSDGIMIARGDLGVEVPMERLPSMQKMIIRKCIERAKPVIVATQLMDSMIENPYPTRAEITDVANAVLDGADAVMLSAETAMGKHPPLVIKAMTKIIAEAEKQYPLAIKDKRPGVHKDSDTFYSDAICIHAGKTAEEASADGLIGLTASGYTAFKLSSFRPSCPIYIFSDRDHMLKTLNICWGVKCLFYDKFTSTDETIDDLIEILKEKQHLKVGDVVVNTGSMPLHKRQRTNFLKITKVE